MPLYEYKCESCGDVFEVLQKFSDTPLTVHAKCGAGPVERLISTSALMFKGSGFYITDYAKGSGEKTDSKSESAKSDTKDSTKGDGKDGKKDVNGSGKPASESSSKESSTKKESKTSDSSSTSTSSTP